MKQSTASLLKIRPLRLFYTARTTAALGDAMLPVAMSFAVLHAGYGASGLGYVLAVFTMMFVLFVLVGGVLADRFGPKALMAGADLVRFSVQTFATVVIATGHTPFALFMACSVINGIATGLFQPGVGSVLPRIAEGRVQQASGLIGSSVALLTVVGTGCAGALIAVGGPATVYGINAATFLASAVCLLRLPLPRVARPADRLSWGADMAEGWREFTARKWLWSVIAAFAFRGLVATGPFSILMISTLTVRHGAAVFGLVLSCQGVGAVLGGLTAVRFQPAKPLRTAFVVTALAALPMLALGFGAPIAVICVTALIGDWGRSYQYILWTATEQLHIPPQILNRLFAYDVAGCVSLIAAGQALGGPLGAVLGDRQAMLFCAVMSTASCAVILMVPAVRRLPAKPYAAADRAADATEPPDPLERPAEFATVAGV